MTDDSLSERVRSAQYDATIKLLSNGVRADNLLTLVDNARTLTSQLMNAIEQKSDPLACKVGCHFCCYLMATVSAPEALTIVQRLKETCSQQELEDIQQKIEWAYEQTQELDNLARVRARIPCPFLAEEGTCTIYAYRPLDCVTYHSLSRQACEEILVQPERGHPANAGLQAVGIGIKTGLGQGIVAANLEHPALRYELIEAMHICLNDEQAMGKYLAGKNIFKPAAIIIDSERGLSYKIKYAPPHLKAEAKRVIALERRKARLDKRKHRKGKGQA
jgi:Fe-S-cluster containining protein